MKLFSKIKQAIRWRVAKYFKDDPDKEFNAVHQHFFGDKEAVTIFDVGAHKGESVARFKELFPDANMHVFEPDEDNFAILQSKAEPYKNITLNNVGVSEKSGSLTFHRNLKSSTSGFHKINTESDWAVERSARYGVAPEDYTSKSYDVPVIGIDQYLKDTQMDHVQILKIDTQGHEDDVLKGAQDALKNGKIDLVETEVMLGDAYEKTLHFSDIEALLLPHGYVFYGIDTKGSLLNMPDMAVNVIYVHKTLLKSA